MSGELRQSALAAADLSEVPDVEPREYDVVVNGIRLHLLDWETRPGLPAVLFLHGAGLTAHSWALTCLQLCDRYRCIVPDLRGHGTSEWSSRIDYSPEAQRGDICALFDALALTPLSIVGLSLGAGIALDYAASGGRTCSLVLIECPGPAGGMAPSHLSVGDGEWASYEQMIDDAALLNPRRQRALLERSLLQNAMQLPNGKWTWRYDRRHRIREDFAAVRADWWAARLGRQSELARSVRCPTLIVWGQDSSFVTQDQQQALLTAFRHAEDVKVVDAGHHVPGDNPKSFAAILTSFLSRVANSQLQELR